MEISQLSIKNHKMKHGFVIWNLPEKITCPGSTAMCRENCYAVKASKQYYHTAIPSRKRNHESSLQDDFAAEMIHIIGKIVKRKSFNGLFRIHEAGDFYSQEYLNKWIDICAAFPKVKFLAFTKSFHLDFSRIPANLQIVNSVWPDTTATILSQFPIAYAGNCRDDNTIECFGQCDNCGICWNLSEVGKNVHFNIH